MCRHWAARKYSNLRGIHRHNYSSIGVGTVVGISVVGSAIKKTITKIYSYGADEIIIVSSAPFYSVTASFLKVA